MSKLVVHIGQGKTGTSSIQNTLSLRREELAAQGVAYLGMKLERARNADRPDWQVRPGPHHLFIPGNLEAKNLEIERVLTEEFARLSAEGIHTAIWSNEQIGHRPEFVQPALKALEAKGIAVEIQCYVRRHDDWARSAYAQWGLKHKNYEGQIVPFATWLGEHSAGALNFIGMFRLWNDAFGPNFRLFNYDEITDIVAHFLTANGVQGIGSENQNVSPGAAVTAVQSVYNNMRIANTRPEEFDAILGLTKIVDQTGATLPRMDQLLPSEADLAGIVETYRGDIAAVNALLVERGEPPLSFEPPLKGGQHPDPWEVDQVTLKLVFALMEEVKRLRTRIEGLEARLPPQPPKGERT